MCHKIVKTTYSGCGGHLVTKSEGPARFCLVQSPENKTLHFNVVKFKRDDGKCPRCVCAAKIREAGTRLPRAELQDKINAAHAKTDDYHKEIDGRKNVASGEQALNGLDAAQCAQLNKTARSSIAFQLGKNLWAGAKVDLFRAILALPDGMDKKGLVTLFGSRYGPYTADWEARALNLEARRAGFQQTLKSAMANGPVAV